MKKNVPGLTFLLAAVAFASQGCFLRAEDLLEEKKKVCSTTYEVAIRCSKDPRWKNIRIGCEGVEGAEKGPIIYDVPCDHEFNEVEKCGLLSGDCKLLYVNDSPSFAENCCGKCLKEVETLSQCLSIAPKTPSEARPVVNMGDAVPAIRSDVGAGGEGGAGGGSAAEGGQQGGDAGSGSSGDGGASEGGAPPAR